MKMVKQIQDRPHETTLTIFATGDRWLFVHHQITTLSPMRIGSLVWKIKLTRSFSPIDTGCFLLGFNGFKIFSLEPPDKLRHTGNISDTADTMAGRPYITPGFL